MFKQDLSRVVWKRSSCQNLNLKSFSKGKQGLALHFFFFILDLCETSHPAVCGLLMDLGCKWRVQAQTKNTMVALCEGIDKLDCPVPLWRISGCWQWYGLSSGLEEYYLWSDHRNMTSILCSCETLLSDLHEWSGHKSEDWENISYTLRYLLSSFCYVLYWIQESAVTALEK